MNTACQCYVCAGVDDLVNNACRVPVHCVDLRMLTGGYYERSLSTGQQQENVCISQARGVFYSDVK